MEMFVKDRKDNVLHQCKTTVYEHLTMLSNVNMGDSLFFDDQEYIVYKKEMRYHGINRFYLDSVTIIVDRLDDIS